MKYWCIEPRDTALFRDARPFGDGAPAMTLSFPWPSTLAGFVRSRLGLNAQGDFEWTPDEARAVRVRGPWLAELDPHSGEVLDHLFAAPRDVVFFRPDEQTIEDTSLHRRRLAPREPAEDEWSDLPEGMQLVSFVTPPDENPGKPSRGPSMWSREVLQSWLDASGDELGLESVQPATLGLSMLPRERRIHVKIKHDTQTADEGFLYQTEQLRFLLRQGRNVRRFGFIAATEDDVNEARMLKGPDSFGGERRISFVSETDARPLRCPDIGQDEIVRVLLLTPAIFERGWCPGSQGLGEGAEVVAAAVDRYQAISGWSFEHRGPKPTRRLAPAGSVYWVRVPGGAQAWASERHLTCISDDHQDRMDGFGLIAIGRV